MTEVCRTCYSRTPNLCGHADAARLTPESLIATARAAVDRALAAKPEAPDLGAVAERIRGCQCHACGGTYADPGHLVRVVRDGDLVTCHTTCPRPARAHRYISPRFVPPESDE